MGFGDQLLAAGQAKLIHRATGQKVAIGRRPKVSWSVFYENNPYLSENGRGCEWLIDYPGHRGYIIEKTADRFIWNHDYKAEPAEIFFGPDEVVTQGDYVVIESNVKGGASPGKSYPHFQSVVDLVDVEFRQPSYGLPTLRGVTPVQTTLRSVAMLIAGARAYVGPDGCLHHLAAALGKPAVVIFGGFAPPDVLGYDFHTNLGEGGMGYRFEHGFSRAAMGKIRPETVAEALRELLD